MSLTEYLANGGGNESERANVRVSLRLFNVPPVNFLREIITEIEKKKKRKKTKKNKRKRTCAPKIAFLRLYFRFTEIRK